MQQDNLLHGRFLAELTKEVFMDLEETKYQHTEYRISIYGRKTVEWDILAAWICQHRLYSDNNVWLIQVGFSGAWTSALGLCSGMSLTVGWLDSYHATGFVRPKYARVSLAQP
jgi:hypothetical protein